MLKFSLGEIGEKLSEAEAEHVQVVGECIVVDEAWGKE